MDLTQIGVALAVGLPATIAAIGAIIQGWQNAKRLDENTRLTKAGAVEASSNAKDAATAATEAKEVSTQIAKSLNGALDLKIKTAIADGVAGVLAEFRAHAKQDEENFEALRSMLEKRK